MPTATLQVCPIEVPCMKHGRPTYRWTNGYLVSVDGGPKQYPPLRLNDARKLAREMGATRIEIDRKGGW